jgi:hypothetical protein
MIFTCTKFTGHCPTGVAAVIRAESAGTAAFTLNCVLQERGLEGDARPEDMIPFTEDDAMVRVLCDGNY